MTKTVYQIRRPGTKRAMRTNY